MPVRVTPEQREERARVRAALLRAALQLAAEHGFASLGLREVARAAGIAPTSFYRHFSDMQELGLALIRELVTHSLRAFGERVRTVARAALAQVLVEAMYGAVTRDAELMRFVLAERVGANAGFRALLRAEQDGLTAALHAAIEGGADARVTGPSLTAVVTTALALEACAELLDEAPAGRGALRQRLLSQLGLQLTPDGVARGPA